MGRPRIHSTDEERSEAVKEWRKTSKAKTKNITVEADLVDALNEKADELQALFGFRPTLSQTLRHLLLRKAP